MGECEDISTWARRQAQINTHVHTITLGFYIVHNI